MPAAVAAGIQRSAVRCPKSWLLIRYRLYRYGSHDTTGRQAIG
jgi:hypothetical protein